MRGSIVGCRLTVMAEDNGAEQEWGLGHGAGAVHWAVGKMPTLLEEVGSLKVKVDQFRAGGRLRVWFPP